MYNATPANGTSPPVTQAPRSDPSATRSITSQELLRGLPRAPYKGIIADPPWLFRTRSAKGQKKSAQIHYACLSPAEIRDLPIADLADKDCILWLWATWPHLPLAIEALQSWGFTYKSGGSWAKISRGGNRWHFGTGYIFRSATEPFLIGTRGQPRLKGRDIRNLIAERVREHSRKPDQQYKMMEKMTDGPYAELFARNRWPGWDAWGDQLAPVYADPSAAGAAFPGDEG